MNRLSAIKLLNKSWFTQVTEFLGEHPEFKKLLPILALDEYPSGFNKNPNENSPYAAKNIFETILFGISISNVPQEDGKKKFVELIKYLREVPFYYKDMHFNVNLEDKKRKTFQNLINDLIDNEINPNNMTLDDLHIPQRIIGIGDTVLDLVYLLYAEVDDERAVPFMEDKFVEGMNRLYRKQMTPMEIREKTETWKNKKVGVMFITQYAYYHRVLGEE